MWPQIFAWVLTIQKNIVGVRYLTTLPQISENQRLRAFSAPGAVINQIQRLGVHRNTVPYEIGFAGHTHNQRWPGCLYVTSHEQDSHIRHNHLRTFCKRCLLPLSIPGLHPISVRTVQHPSPVIFNTSYFKVSLSDKLFSFREYCDVSLIYMASCGVWQILVSHSIFSYQTAPHLDVISLLREIIMCFKCSFDIQSYNMTKLFLRFQIFMLYYA